MKTVADGNGIDIVRTDLRWAISLCSISSIAHALEQRGCATSGVVLDQVSLACAGGSSLCVKPVADGDGAGVARIDSAADLAAYAHALAARAGAIPEGVLSTPQPRGLVPMPTAPPADFLVEPFIQADRCARGSGTCLLFKNRVR